VAAKWITVSDTRTIVIMDAHHWRVLQRITALCLAGATLSGCAALLGIEDVNQGAPVDGSVPVVDGAVDIDIDAGPRISGEITWVRSLGDMSPYSVAVHVNDGLMIAGSTTASVDLGGGPLVPFGGYDMVLAELDAADAAHRWSTRFGDVGDEFSFLGGTPFDSAGDWFVHGVSYGTVNLGLGTVASAGLADTYVGRYPRDGGPPAWLQRITTVEEDKFLDTVSGPGDSIFVSGYLVGSVSLGGQTLTSAGGRDILLARLAGADGQVLLARSWGGPGLDEGNSVTWTGSDVILSGRFEQSFAFDPTLPESTVVSQGARDLYVAKLKPDGDLAWARSFGGIGTEDGTAVEIDGAGNVYLYGSFEDTVAFGAVNLTSAGARDVFLAKLDPGGNVLWARSFGGPADEAQVNLAVAADGTAVVTGWTQGDVDVGGGLVASKGGFDTFIASYDTVSGEHRWSHVFGTGGDDRAWGVALDDNGSAYVTMTTAEPLQWSQPVLGLMPDPTAMLLAIAR
jgi:hypothetical protein